MLTVELERQDPGFANLSVERMMDSTCLTPPKRRLLGEETIPPKKGSLGLSKNLNHPGYNARAKWPPGRFLMHTCAVIAIDGGRRRSYTPRTSASVEAFLSKAALASGGVTLSKGLVKLPRVTSQTENAARQRKCHRKGMACAPQTRGC